MNSDVWQEVKLQDVILFNPTETIKKGAISKKVGMDKLNTFQRKIEGFEITKFSSGTKFRNGDTLLARITPCLENGKTAQVTILQENEVGFGSTEFIVMREKEGVTDNNYIYYLSISPKIREIAIKSMTGTSGRQRAQIDVLKNAIISLPPLEEQKKIANVLSSLDEKIEINKQIIKKLEEIAQSIYKQWFVYFEFPGENGKPYKSNGGEMVQSEIGIIPKGWEVNTLGNIVDLSTKSVNPQKFPERLFEHFSIPALDNNKTPDVQLGKEIKSSKYIINDNVVLISKLNPTTKRIWRPYPQGQYPICSTEFMVYVPKEENILSFIYELINSDTFSQLLVSHATGSTGSRQRVKPSDTLQFKFIIPPNNIMNEFSKIVEPIHNIISLRIIENRKLSKTRDSILPKLMSGEIRVPLEN